MKMGSSGYLLKEGFKNTWANRLMTIASVGVLVACMVVIGLALLISENVKLAFGNLEKQNVVMAYMKDYSWAYYGNNDEETVKDEITNDDYVIHSDEEGKALCEKIEEIDNVEKAEFISAEEGLNDVKKNMLDGQEEYFAFLEEDGGNPISCAAKVTMKDMSLFDKTIKEIEKLDGIDVIQSQNDLAEKITAIKRGVEIAGFWIIAILLIISLVIVSNTIRVTMYNRKLEISIMKAVGATDAFIRIPFVVEGMTIGLISAVISEGLLYFCYRVATEAISKTLQTADIIKFGDVAIYLFLVFALIGIVSGAIGSFIMIGKYLRKEGSEFAAI